MDLAAGIKHHLGLQLIVLLAQADARHAAVGVADHHSAAGAWLQAQSPAAAPVSLLAVGELTAGQVFQGQQR